MPYWQKRCSCSTSPQHSRKTPSSKNAATRCKRELDVSPPMLMTTTNHHPPYPEKVSGVWHGDGTIKHPAHTPGQWTVEPPLHNLAEYGYEVMHDGEAICELGRTEKDHA